MGFIRLLLILAILGGLGYGGYYFWQQRQKAQAAQAEAEASPTPTPEPKVDPAREALDAIWATYNEGDVAAAREALKAYTAEYPYHTLIWEAQDLLGKINSNLLFGPGTYEGEKTYVVESGDTLSRISAREDTTVDFLLVANQLDSPLIRIGQELQVIPATFTVRVDLPNRCVFLARNEEFFRYYPFVDQSLRDSGAAETETGKVLRKMAWRDGKQVPPGTEGYLDSARWLVTSVDGITLYNTVEPTAMAENATEPEASSTPDPAAIQTPTGQRIQLTQEAMKELCALVSSGNEVSVIFSQPAE